MSNLALNADKGAPAVTLKSVTPADGSDLPDGPARGLYVGGAGNIAVTTPSGDSVTITGVTQGSVLPFEIARVKSTNTTATSILAIY